MARPNSRFRTCCLLAGLLALGLPYPLNAQTADSPSPTAPGPPAAKTAPPSQPPASVPSRASLDVTPSEEPGASAPADVVVANRVVATLRGSRLGYSPKDRAGDAEEKIGFLLGQGVAGPVTAVPFAEGYRIQIGGKGVFNLLSTDQDPVSDETPEQVRDRVVRQLQEALRASWEQRRPAVVLRGIALVAVATVLAGFLVWLSLWLMTKLRERMAATAPSRLIRVNEELAAFFSSPLRAWLNWLTRIGLVAVVVLVMYLWVTFSLRQFPLTQPWGDASRGFMLSLLQKLGWGILGQVPNLCFVLLIYCVARAVSKLLKLFFLALEEGRIKLPGLYPDTVPMTRRLAVAALWIFALVMAYPYLPGSDSLAFKGVSVFFGLLVSIGSSGVISQAASGIILVYSRAFQPGDYIQAGETEGTVMDVGILSTKVRTIKQEVINLPNSLLIGSTCKNYSTLAKEQGLIVHTTVTIGYDTPWRQVEAMLLMAAGRTAALRQEPMPFVLQTALSDFYPEYQLNAYLDEPHRRIDVLAELHAHIQDVFNEYGVQIMSPHYRSDPSGAAKVVPKEHWYAAPAQKPSTAD